MNAFRKWCKCEKIKQLFWNICSSIQATIQKEWSHMNKPERYPQHSHAYRYVRRHVNIINYQVGCSKCMFSNITHFYLIMLQMLFIAYIVFFLIFQKLLKKHAIYKFTEKRKRTKSSAKLQHTQTVWLENIFIRNYKKNVPSTEHFCAWLTTFTEPTPTFHKKIKRGKW